MAHTQRTLIASIVPAIGAIAKTLLGGWNGCCRFNPSCSQYARQALLQHGVLRGGILTFLRIVRCGPWSKGGFDPVALRTGSNNSE